MVDLPGPCGPKELKELKELKEHAQEASMQTLRSVGVLSFAKLIAVTSALVALIIGVIYGLIIMVFGAGAALGGGEDAGLLAGGGVLAGLAVMVLFPVIYAVFGFLGGLIYGFFLNLALRIVGGLEIEIS